MRENRVKSIWDKGGVVIAGGVSLGSIYAAEVMAHQGFDCLFVDMQHAPQDYLQVFAMLQAISATDTVPIVRVPWNNPADIMRAGQLGPIVGVDVSGARNNTADHVAPPE